MLHNLFCFVFQIYCHSTYCIGEKDTHLFGKGSRVWIKASEPGSALKFLPLK